MNATISADIISSTSLSIQEMTEMRAGVEQWFNDISAFYGHRNGFGFWGRLVKGDSIECFIENPHDALRIALMLKVSALLISEHWESDANDNTLSNKIFTKYGIRLAIGIGEMRIVDRQNGILDGEAIYRSGRAISDQTTNGKQKIIVKNTLFFACGDRSLEQQMNVMLGFMDQIYRRATSRQMRVLLHKLKGLTDKEVAQAMQLSVSTVNQHCTAIGWNAISDMLNYYENTLYPIC